MRSRGTTGRPTATGGGVKSGFSRASLACGIRLSRFLQETGFDWRLAQGWIIVLATIDRPFDKISGSFSAGLTAPLCGACFGMLGHILKHRVSAKDEGAPPLPL
jgi:hypothetical protein